MYEHYDQLESHILFGRVYICLHILFSTEMSKADLKKDTDNQKSSQFQQVIISAIKSLLL